MRIFFVLYAGNSAKFIVSRGERSGATMPTYFYFGPPSTPDHREQYTPDDALAVCRWLNCREGGYTEPHA